jgi:putative membrane protein insertion efficiency factor
MNAVTGTPVATIEGSHSEEPAQTPGGVPRPQGPVVRLLVAAIHAYQFTRIGRVSPCRFTPTCSHYAVEAVSRHGARKGLVLTARRLGRCRPGGPYGFDPVPEHPLSRMREQ